jgi:lysozyme
MIIKEAIDLIKSFESFSSEIYLCPAGFETIGYGHLVLKNEDFSKGINHEDAMNLLMIDINIAKYSVLKNINISLDLYQLGALISFAFNVGGAALQRSTLRQKINDHAHELVPNELRKWVFANGKKLPGLIRRREAEGRLYLKNS